MRQPTGDALTQTATALIRLDVDVATEMRNAEVEPGFVFVGTRTTTAAGEPRINIQCLKHGELLVDMDITQHEATIDLPEETPGFRQGLEIHMDAFLSEIVKRHETLH